MVRLLHILSQQTKVSGYFLIALLISIFIGGIDTKGYAQTSCRCTFTASGGTAASPLNWNNSAIWSRTDEVAGPVDGCAGKTLPGPDDCVVIATNSHVRLSSGTINVMTVTNNGNLTVTGSTTRLNIGPFGNTTNRIYLISGNSSTLTVINAGIVDVWGGWASANNGNTSAVGGTAGFFNVRNCGLVGGNPNVFQLSNSCDNINAPLASAGTLIYCITCPGCQASLNTTTQRQSNVDNIPGCRAIVTPLPITLVSFEAFAQQEENSQEPYVALRWTTAREIDNDFFTIERSTDGESFIEIQRIPGAGNSDAVISYGTSDNTPLHGISYYRLKQTDFDGTFTYSKVVSVRVNLSLASRLSVYPNPNSSSRFFLNMKSEEVKSLAIYDLSGRLQEFCTNFELTSQGLQPVSDTQLSKGSYLVKVLFADGQTAVRKLMVQ